MASEITSIRNAQVVRDDALTHRWFDAFGEGVAKYVTSFTSLPADDSTTDPTEFVMTVVEAGAGTSTAVIGDVAGGALTITCAAGENDGVSLQLGNPNSGEWASFAAEYPTYFGIRFQGNDVDQTDFFFGLAVTDTTLLGGVTDGMYFRSVDGSSVLNFVLEKDSAESATAVGTLTDATDVTAEFFYSGSNVYVYVDGTLQATIADSDANFPNDELLRLSMEVLTGEAVANTCQVSWVRLIQIQA
jgi:hypothetical protein